MPAATYELTYWPIAFRGCFISYLFAYADTPLVIKNDMDDIIELKSQDPAEQPIPFTGPPILKNLETGFTISQMPAAVLHASRHLGLWPETPEAQEIALKVIMDCNDVLMEICQYNGTFMWERADWIEFRSHRLARWMRLFEASLDRGHLGGATVTCADIATFALFGTMTRCLPELATDLDRHAPGVAALCQRLGQTPSLAAFIKDQQEVYGDTYCGGQIEQSIRHMLSLDQAEKP